MNLSNISTDRLVAELASRSNVLTVSTELYQGHELRSLYEETVAVIRAPVVLAIDYTSIKEPRPQSTSALSEDTVSKILSAFATESHRSYFELAKTLRSPSCQKDYSFVIEKGSVVMEKRMNLSSLTEKELKIIEQVEDAILSACDDFKASKSIDVGGLNALIDGIRVLNHVRQLKGSLFTPTQEG